MPHLNQFILIVGALIVLGILFWFLRKPSNRNPEQYRHADGSGGTKIDPEVER